MPLHGRTVNPYRPLRRISRVTRLADDRDDFGACHAHAKLLQMLAAHSRTERAPAHEQAKSTQHAKRRDHHEEPQLVGEKRVHALARIVAERAWASSPSASAKVWTARKDFFSAARLYSTTLVRR